MDNKEPTMDRETLIREALINLINDMLAYPENYPMGAVYHVIRALELLKEEKQDD